MLSVSIDVVLIGKAEPLGPPGYTSGIRKHPVTEPVALGTTGFSGDEQGDRRHHGGPEKAVHHYPFDHYAPWRREHPQLARHFASPGAFGENFSTRGVNEDAVCVGDVFQAGSALLQVSQARQPCWKLNARFERDDMARLVQASGRTGWYYRVLREGRVGPGDRLVLVERPNPTWTLGRLLRCLYVDTLDRDALAAMAQIRTLAESWRKVALWRLENGRVEDWNSRLDTPKPQ